MVPPFSVNAFRLATRRRQPAVNSEERAATSLGAPHCLVGGGRRGHPQELRWRLVRGAGSPPGPRQIHRGRRDGASGIVGNHNYVELAIQVPLRMSASTSAYKECCLVKDEARPALVDRGCPALIEPMRGRRTFKALPVGAVAAAWISAGNLAASAASSLQFRPARGHKLFPLDAAPVRR